MFYFQKRYCAAGPPPGSAKLRDRELRFRMKKIRGSYYALDHSNEPADALNMKKKTIQERGKSLLEISKNRGVSYEAVVHMKDRRDIKPIGKRGRASLYDPAEFQEKETAGGGVERTDWRRRFEKARTEKLEIQNAKARGELIDRALIARVFSQIYSIDRSILMNIGAAHAGTIAALGGDTADRSLKIQKIIDGEIYAALGAVKAEINKFLNQTGCGKIEDAVPEPRPTKPKAKPPQSA